TTVAGVDRRAEIDPAREGHLLVDGERRHAASGRRHRFAGVVEVRFVRIDTWRQRNAGCGLARMVGVRPAVEALAEDLPHQQAPPALEATDVAARVRLPPGPVRDD